MEINIGDWNRILIGDVPGHFYIELPIRAAFIYFILMTSMRIMGKRMSSELSRNEMAAVVSLAAAIGVPLMNADRGLLPVLIIAAVIICYQVLIARQAARSERFESLTQDKISLLVKDGVMQLENMEKTRISRERIFSEVRASEIKQLGEVKRLYLEAAGHFSLIISDQPLPGLCILPDWDEDFRNRMEIEHSYSACKNCGKTVLKQDRIQNVCDSCGRSHLEEAVR